MKPVENRELSLRRAPNRTPVPFDAITKLRDVAHAFRFACEWSGLEDKEIYLELEMDKGQFSKTKHGEYTLKAELIEKFCEVVGNNVYVEFLAYQRGCKLVLIQTEAERQRDEALARLARKEEENRLLRDVLQGKA